MTITPELLKKIVPGNKNPKLLASVANSMNQWFPEFGIDTLQEIRHFIAQTAHESANYNTLEEYATGEDYEGRLDLGNTKPGDGKKFKGHGIMQVTGRANHYAMGVKLGQPTKFILNPELLATPEYAVWSACVFWTERHLNDFANMPDTALITTKKKGKLSPLKYITYRVNGGFNGLAQRQRFYERSKAWIK